MNLITKESAIQAYEDSLHGKGSVYGMINNCPSAFEGMTNGEVMKAIFPDIEVTINEFLGSVVIDGAFGRFITTLDWWLVSYKGGE